MDFYNYNLEDEIEKIKSIKYNASDLYYYSADKIVHKLYNIPNDIDISAYLYHSLNVTDFEMKDYALMQEANLPILATRQSQVDYLVSKGAQKERTFCTGLLFFMYRRMQNIEKSKSAKGTIVFPAHSCSVTDVIIDWNLYIEKLKLLPDEFKPINICLYFKDILNGSHKVFLENGFDVYTAGHCNDPDFVDNFYEIARHHKYATTNGEYVSSLFYTSEMGIDSFIYAAETHLGDVENDNFVNTGFESLDTVSDNYQNKYIDFFREIFPQYPNTQISKESFDKIIKKAGLDYQTPKDIVKKALINYTKYKKVNPTTTDKIRQFIFKKDKIGEKRVITLLNTIKFSYKKKQTKKDICEI